MGVSTTRGVLMTLTTHEGTVHVGSGDDDGVFNDFDLL